MKPQKLKMSNFKFRAITIPVMSILLILAIVLTTVTNYFTPSLDAFLGKGERIVSAVAGADKWDTNFYTFKTTNSKDALDVSSKVAESIGNEGEVLLKNDGLLPLTADTVVTPLGYDYLNPIMSGSGSGSTDTTASYVYNAERGINEAFKNVNTTVVNAMKKGTTVVAAPLGTSGEGGQTAFLGSGTSITEFDLATYEGIEKSCEGTVGIVFIGRKAGEGSDLYTQAYDDGTPHQLALTAAEKDLIEFTKTNCTGGVVVVLNACNAMQVAELEDDAGINAILQICSPGAMGFKSLGNILNGTVNPSGRIVDTFLADNTKNPTFVNFDNGTLKTSYDNATYTRAIWLSRFKGGPDFNAPFREYEEGVYMGYRWYETASDLGFFTSSNLPAGVTDPYYNRDNGVVYPFGYGLSYTTFTQEIVSFDDNGDEITVNVKVTNTGKTYAGKEVVQLYYNAPYTQFDVDNMIEKSTANLVAFGKTAELAPGASETVTLTFAKEDMASYCFTHKNGNGTTGCYVMEAGEYEITLRANSHVVIDTRTTKVPETIWYDGSDNDHIRASELAAQSALDADGNPLGIPADTNGSFVAATNLFENANTYMTDPSVGNDVTILTRNDWANTQPSAPTDATRHASEQVVEWLDFNYTTTDLGKGEWDSVNDPLLGDKPGTKVYVAPEDMPASKANNGLQMSDMRGLEYSDPLWEDLLDQVDYTSDEINSALFANGYASGELNSVGKMNTTEHDGPQGLSLNDTSGNSWVSCCSFPAATTLAQTWNIDLAYAMGSAVGEENYWVDGAGWYAPAVNLHWSAFSGRNYEYYSEDPLISGKMAAGVISGAGDMGTYCALKHFAMVDQEEHRWWIPSVWATEQTVRELYLKAFEVAVKEATKTIRYISDDMGTVSTKTMRACDCMMTSGWSGIGGLFSAYDHNLLTGVLRNEWGFRGFVITDYDQGNCENDNIAVNRMVRAGTDQHMIDMTLAPGKYTSLDNATGVAALRNAIKNTLYTMANSAQLQGAAPGTVVSYKMSPWRIAVITLDVIFGLAIVYLVFENVRRTKEYQLHPENFKAHNSKK